MRSGRSPQTAACTSSAAPTGCLQQQQPKKNPSAGSWEGSCAWLCCLTGQHQLLRHHGQGPDMYTCMLTHPAIGCCLGHSRCISCTASRAHSSTDAQAKHPAEPGACMHSLAEPGGGVRMAPTFWGSLSAYCASSFCAATSSCSSCCSVASFAARSACRAGMQAGHVHAAPRLPAAFNGRA